MISRRVGQLLVLPLCSALAVSAPGRCATLTVTRSADGGALTLTNSTISGNLAGNANFPGIIVGEFSCPLEISRL